MADSQYIVELQETIEKMNAELSQPNTKISELCVKVREQEEAAQKEMAKLREENARLSRDLKQSEEKCNAVQERLEFVEQKLAEFSQKPEVTVEESLAQAMEPNDDALNINSLPAEVLVNIFSHLSQNELGKIARVCRRWNELTKSPVLWKEVSVELHKSLESHTTVAKCFVNKLPSCVTLLRLYYWEFNDCTEKLNFEELCVTLQKRCPHLKTLILECVQLSDNLTAVLVLCSQFLPDLKNLIFCQSVFADCPTGEKFSSTSKIEVLGVSSCNQTLKCFQPPFIRMPNLKKLSLYDTWGIGSWFQGYTSFFDQIHVLDLGGTDFGLDELTTVVNHGRNLRELYICSTPDLSGRDFNFLRFPGLKFNNSALPHLKTICLKGWRITYIDVVDLVYFFQSLQNIYVIQDVAIRYARHPFVVANKCKLEIVKSTFDCNHHQIVNRF